MDHLQDAQAAELDALQQLGRLPDAVAPEARDCADCGAEIPTRRLAAVPTATRCVLCEEIRSGGVRWTGRSAA